MRTMVDHPGLRRRGSGRRSSAARFPATAGLVIKPESCLTGAKL